MPFIAVVVLVILAILAIILGTIEYVALWVVRWYEDKPKISVAVHAADEMPTEFDEDDITSEHREITHE